MTDSILDQGKLEVGYNLEGQMTEPQDEEDCLTRMGLQVSKKWVLIMKNNEGFASSDDLA